MTIFLLALIVLLGITVEAAIGFGATVITLALAVNIVPLEVFLATFLPVNYCLFLYLTIKYYRHIEKRILLTRILPAMGLGMPIGMAVFNLVDSMILNGIYAAFVIVLSTLMLLQISRHSRQTPQPLRAAVRLPLLFIGGVIHGLYSTGGPMIVYYLAREPIDKRAFRVTLAMVWLIMGTVLLINYAAIGLLTRATLRDSALLLAPLVGGIGLGELLHGRVNERLFRIIVFALLLAVGSLLLIKTLV